MPSPASRSPDALQAHPTADRGARARPVGSGQAARGGPLAGLQNTAGNAAVGRMIEGMEGPRSVEEIALSGFQGPRSPLPYQSEMERHFDSDFRDVGVYTTPEACAANRALGSHGYSDGNRIAFGSREPSMSLVAHELAHVVQSRSGRNDRLIRFNQQGASTDSLEAEANEASTNIGRGNQTGDSGSSDPYLDDRGLYVEDRGGGEHVVQEGDSLWAIANAAYGDGTKWREICTKNPGKVSRNGDLILIGSTLSIPVLAIPLQSSTSTADGSTVSQDTLNPSAGAPDTDGQPPGAKPTSQTQDGTEGTDGLTTAVNCLYPDVALPLPIIESQPVEFCNASISGKATGNLSATKEGDCDFFGFDPKEFSISAQREITKAIEASFSLSLQVDDTGMIGLKEIKIDIAHTTWGNASVSMDGPTSMTFSFESLPIEFEVGGYKVSGSIGFEVTVSTDGGGRCEDPTAPAPVFVPFPAPAYAPTTGSNRRPGDSGEPWIKGGVALAGVVLVVLFWPEIVAAATTVAAASEAILVGSITYRLAAELF